MFLFVWVKLFMLIIVRMFLQWNCCCCVRDNIFHISNYAYVIFVDRNCYICQSITIFCICTRTHGDVFWWFFVVALVWLKHGCKSKNMSCDMEDVVSSVSSQLRINFVMSSVLSMYAWWQSMLKLLWLWRRSSIFEMMYVILIMWVCAIQNAYIDVCLCCWGNQIVERLHITDTWHLQEN